MIIASSLNPVISLEQPVALTIGNFDGVHLGHQYLLTELKKHGTPVVVTFSNHPLEVLRPHDAPPCIISLEDKLDLLRQMGIAATFVLPFTQELAQTPYDRFIDNLQRAIPFSTLVGGEDIRVGYRGEGDATRIQALSKKMRFEAIFLSKITINGEIVSSRQIRKLIQNQQLDQARKWLGHSKGIAWLDSLVEL